MRRALLASCLLAVACAPPAQAEPKLLWATVNACAPAGAAGHVVGVRASMPGTGRRRQRMYMHFAAQYYDEASRRWKATGASSPWLRVGSARWRATQKGYSFAFRPPAPGVQYYMRGLVKFQWRAKRRGRWRVVKRARRGTRGGIANVLGGSSAGRCLISG